MGDLEQSLNKVAKSLSELRLIHLAYKFPLAILDLKLQQRMGNQGFARSALPRIVVRVIGEMHVGMRFIRKYPLRANPLQDNDQFIAVAETKGRKDGVAIVTARQKLYLSRHFLLECLLYGLEGHVKTSP